MESDKNERKRPEHPWVDINGNKRFKPGNPGRPKGCLNKETRLKHAVLDALAVRESELKVMPIDKLLTVGASFVPKNDKLIQENERIVVVVNNRDKGNDSRTAVRPASQPADNQG